MDVKGGREMPGESLLALAALAGQMVVDAAGTDEWEAAGRGSAQLLGRKDAKQTKLVELWLEDSREQLASGAGPDMELIRTALAGRWARRWADLLEEEPDAEVELRALVEEIQAALPAEQVSVSNRAASAQGDVGTQAAGPDHPGALAARSELAYSAGQAGGLRSEQVAGWYAKLPDHSSHSGMLDGLVTDAEHDRDMVAAMTAGDLTGIAMAYDRYAASLYGYCHWMLHDPADAAESLRDTFVLAVATLSELPEPTKLRPWLFAVARNECRRRLLSESPAHREDAGGAGRRAGGADQPIDYADQSADATLQFPAIDRSPDAAHQPADATLQFPAIDRSPDAAHQPADATLQFHAIDGVNGHTELAEQRTLTRTILATLEPSEREVIELSLRHNLYDTDLATALGVPWGQAHALISDARRRLERNLGVLLIARIGRKACLVLDAQLADWDGQLTEQVCDLVGEHIEQCGICEGRMRGALRPAALSGLQPLVVPPPELRDDVLRLCSPVTPDAPVDGPGAEPVWHSRFSAAIRAMKWDIIRSHPGAAIAAAGIVLWVAAAMGAALLIIGSHSAHPLPARPGTSSAPAPGPTAPRTTAVPTTGRSPTSLRPSPTVSQRSAYLAPSVGPSRTAGTIGQIQAPEQSTSPSPSPPRSSSPSPSPSKSPSSTSPPPSP
jgi:RNA polymerase sigma factor (sigma-70 family)